MLWLLSLVSMLVLLGSSNIVLMYLALETSSLILYPLLVLFRSVDVSASVEASLKYLILSGISSCGLLLGGCIIYWSCGPTDISVLSVGLGSSRAMV